MSARLIGSSLCAAVCCCLFLALPDHLFAQQSPESQSCVDLGCGCDAPAPGDCGCDSTVVDAGCGCGAAPPNSCGCDPEVVDAGCGCGSPGPNSDGCCAGEVDTGCGCGSPAPGECGCDLSIVDEGCGCGQTCSSDECVWVAAWANFSKEEETTGSQTGVSLGQIANQFAINHSSPIPGCFSQWVDSQLNCAMPTTGTDTRRFWGGCRKGDQTNLVPDDLAAFLGVPLNERPNVDPYDKENQGAWFYMDENCQYTTAPDGTEICGFAGTSWSPVSLLWEEGVSLTEGMTVVSFSIAAHQPDAYTLWKASAKAPLLVFDPEDTGRVESARQLFGSSTFGGVTTRLADYRGVDLRATWRNGYEAMALLDQDQDGRLTGTELQPVKLWFDADRDAEVDPGELRAAAGEGITALFFREPQASAGSFDLSLEVGYERIIDGRVVRGGSIDWYSETFSSRQEALAALTAEFGQSGSAVALAAESANPYDFAPHAAHDHRADLSGYWLWTVESGEKHPGVFAFEQTGAEQVQGYSVVETILEKNSRGLRSGVMILPAEGKLEVNAAGQTELKLLIVDRSSGSNAVSTAVLSPDGRTLRGSTKQSFSVKGSSASVDYSWTAKKLH